MRRFLLASVATAGLIFAALPALAQNMPNPTPPVATPQPQTPAETPNPGVGEALQTPSAPTTSAPAANAQALAPQGEDSALAAPAPAPDGQPQTQTAEAGALPTPASAAQVCEARTTSVHFGARGSALSRENRHAIQWAADAASVCNLQAVTIVDSASGRTSSRRTASVRQTLIRQGVPADKINVDNSGAAADAGSTGRLDVRMTFAGAANGNTMVADASPATGVNAAAQPTLNTTMTPVAPGTEHTPSPVPVEPAPAPTPEAQPEPAPDADETVTPAAPSTQHQRHRQDQHPAAPG
jgi:outer membrane protein OmpA-like peptidoglycan-associated protein